MLDYMCACNEIVLLDFEVGGREEGGSRNPILGRTPDMIHTEPNTDDKCVAMSKTVLNVVN